MKHERRGGDEGGFDAFVGNPPWVSYAGRSAQPLDDRIRRFYLQRYRAFAGYRNLQGLFVERVVTLLRPNGRLGLVVPSSMAELDGYAATRIAHDIHAECDEDLPDLGEDAFHGVAQPAMLLRSTARTVPLVDRENAPWPIERPDIDAGARSLLDRLEGAPLPAELFGERGLQSVGADVEHLAGKSDRRHSIPVRAGTDIRGFFLGNPSFFADPAWFKDRLRSPQTWRSVAVLIRQTARVLIASLSDGAAFRNSILAGFSTDDYPAEFLVAYLNSSPIRWRHYYKNRDARLGMPQVKIGHLRSIPAPRDRRLIARLTEWSRPLLERNGGASADEQSQLDGLVADAFDLDLSARQRIDRDKVAWA